MQMNVTSLEQDILFSLVFPLVFLGVGFIWEQLFKGFTRRKKRLWFSTTVGLMFFMLGLSLKSDFGTLKALWLGSPYLFSALYLLFATMVMMMAITILKWVWVSKPGHQKSTPESANRRSHLD